MNDFHYKNGQLYCENLNVNELSSKTGTPFYLYSQKTLLNHYKSIQNAFSELHPTICYSIKNCSNIHIIKALTQQGAGIDIVSGGELYRALQAGADPQKIVYAGVGKTDTEIIEALEANVGWLNVESEDEFDNLIRITNEVGKTCKVAVRINPNVFDSKTPDKTNTGIIDSKFGVDIRKIPAFFKKYGNQPNVQLKGIHFHLGSPIFSGEPYEQALKVVLELLSTLKQEGFVVEMIDIGGGFIAHYSGTEETKTWDEYARCIVPMLKPFVKSGGQVVLEPGRSIAANAGVLVSKVLYTKTGVNKNFVVLDTGMSHLMRPAMYEAYHLIWPSRVNPGLEPVDLLPPENSRSLNKYDIVGPICESSDFFAKDRYLPEVKRGDLMCIFTAGAYGMSMANNYNSVPRPPEVIVRENKAFIIRQRETYDDIISHEMGSTQVL